MTTSGVNVNGTAVNGTTTVNWAASAVSATANTTAAARAIGTNDAEAEAPSDTSRRDPRTMFTDMHLDSNECAPH